MEDNMIIELYWARDEAAISETDAKYGHYCYTVAYNILADGSDAEESVSDTYFARMALHASPPPRRAEELSGQAYAPLLDQPVAEKPRGQTRRRPD